MRRLGVVAIAAQVAGCGAIFNGGTAQVTVTSNVGGEIFVDGQPTGTPAPGVVTVANHKDHLIAVRAPDGSMGTCQLASSVRARYVVPDVVFFLLGTVVDLATGSWKSVDTGCDVQVIRVAAAESTATRSSRTVVTGERPIYCSASLRDPDVGTCSLVEEQCASARDSAISDAAAYTPCAPAKAAACFNAVRVLDDARVTRCAPTIKGCEAQLAALKESPDYTVSADECGVYRVVPAAPARVAPARSQPQKIVDPFDAPVAPEPSKIVDPF